MAEQESELLVNFVARSTLGGPKWKIVLVEQGPWLDVEKELRRLQDRLYDCVDVVLDGKLAEKFPASNGADIVIRLDCYDVPKTPVQKLFGKFAETIIDHPDNKAAIEKSTCISALFFELNFDLDPDEYAKRGATQGDQST